VVHDAEGQCRMRTEFDGARSRHQITEHVGRRHGDSDCGARGDDRRDRRASSGASHDDFIDDPAPHQIR
jgi:hypothetical protein